MDEEAKGCGGVIWMLPEEAAAAKAARAAWASAWEAAVEREGVAKEGLGGGSWWGLALALALSVLSVLLPLPMPLPLPLPVLSMMDASRWKCERKWFSLCCVASASVPRVPRVRFPRKERRVGIQLEKTGRGAAERGTACLTVSRERHRRAVPSWTRGPVDPWTLSEPGASREPGAGG